MENGSADNVFMGGLWVTATDAAGATLPGRPPESLQPVYLDPTLLVLDKPAGLLCVPGRGVGKQDCLSARAQAQWQDALVVHRLDMATSGLCLLARGQSMQRRLSALFAARAVKKRYVAVVAGRLDQAVAGEDGWSQVDLPLAADWPRRPLQKVDPDHGKPSVTRWRVISHERCTTRVELQPTTGRTHQLRVHMHALGHPILGDALYAPPEVASLMPRLALHATDIGLDHPMTGERMHWSSPSPF